MKKICSVLLSALLLLFPVPQPVSAAAEEVRLPVVMYHHISRDRNQYGQYVVSLEEFAADLDYLDAHGWESVGVRELLAWQAGEFEMPEKPFMITFDDGFESTLAYAEPLLADYGFRGVVAVIGSVCEKFTQCGEHEPEWSNLSWEDAAALAERDVVEVQCHTWDMHCLYPRTGCQQKAGESPDAYAAALSADLERFLRESDEHGVDLVPAIAFPFGAFNDETERITESLGFRIGFTCRERVNPLRADEEGFLRLGRFNRPHGVDSARFFAAWEAANP